MRILNDSEKTFIWDKIYADFKFRPSIDTNIKTFDFSIYYEQFFLMSFWSEKEEKIINNIFKEISDSNIYALEWQSDCFEFNPNENIKYEYSYHDEERNVDVYFPTYYPNGDYYFYIAKDFSYGMFTHPWKKQIYVWGDKLIEKVNQNIGVLDLKKIDNNFSSDDSKKIKELYNCKPDNIDIKISPLSKWYNELIEKQISEITVNDVEVMLRQNILLELALEKAIEFLNNDVFIGTKCTGEILVSISKINTPLLKKHVKELKKIAQNGIDKSKKWEFIDEEEKQEIQEAINKILEKLNNKKCFGIMYSLIVSIFLLILAFVITIIYYGLLQGLGVIFVAFIIYVLYSKMSKYIK